MITTRFMPIILILGIFGFAIGNAQITMKKSIMSNSGFQVISPTGYSIRATGSQLAVGIGKNAAPNDAKLYKGYWGPMFDTLNSVEDDELAEYKRINNSPNPFSSRTTIKYSVPGYAKVTLAVYDISGNEITKLVDAFQQAGSYTADFTAVNESGVALGSGSYLYELRVEPYSMVGADAFGAYTVRNIMVLAK